MDHQTRNKRRYELKKRAEEMAETRRRITEAAVELHGTIGPARTTVSAIAERAGVQRHTVYRHFPTEAELFGACSAHYVALHPLPDLEAWRALRDPSTRLTRGLDELYGYYERTEPMWSNVFRDVDLVEAVGPTLVPVEAWLTEAASILMTGWGTRGRRRRVLEAAIRHVLDFQTWRSLASSLPRADATELAAALVTAAAAPSRPPA
jgi:AcrR family transcriptional regulator